LTTSTTTPAATKATASRASAAAAAERTADGYIKTNDCRGKHTPVGEEICRYCNYMQGVNRFCNGYGDAS